MSENANQEIQETTEISLDDLDAQISEIESAIDNVTESSENNTEDASGKLEEASNAFAERIEALEADNKRLAQMVSRLIMVNGARISNETTSGVEAFPSSVEQTFGDEKSIPSLSEIKLAP